MTAEGWRIGLAIGLAVLDAFCFAAAAVYQQRAVRRTVRATAGAAEPSESGGRWQPRLSLRGFVSLVRHPGWLGGIALMGVGVGLHMTALMLAPVSLIQPIGILGVPLAVLLAAKLGRHRPPKSVIIPILVCVAGIAGFIALVSRSVVHDATAPVPILAIAEGVLIVCVVLLAIGARLLHGWRRCVLDAIGGAIAVGMVSALVRAIAGHIDGDLTRLIEPTVLALAGMGILNAAAGGWLVQQAYASGPPDVVLACLTVIDPIVAVLIGLLVLGEGGRFSLGGYVGMVAFAAVAITGVLALARSHPQLSGDRAPDQDRLPQPAAAVRV